MTAKHFVDRGFWFGVIPKLECIRSYQFPVMNKKPRCSLDFFNFSLRGTKIHPKKPAFLRPIKSFIFLKYMPRLHLLPSRISKFSGGEPQDPPPTKKGGTPLLDSPPTHAYGARGHACGMSSLHLPPKILHLLKNIFRTLGNRIIDTWSFARLSNKITKWLCQSVYMLQQQKKI